MTEASFKECDWRLRWVDHALRTFDEEFRIWLLEHEAHPVSVEYHPVADVHVFRQGAQPLPVRFGVVAGNIVHQLRATLDNLVWQLVLANKKTPRDGPGGNQFPIHSDLPRDPNKTFVKRTAGKLRGVHPDHVAFIERLQPYQNPEWLTSDHPLRLHPLEALADLSNTDKHQVLQILSAQEPANRPVPMEFPVSFEGETVDAVIDSWVAPVEQRYPGAVVGWAQLAPSGFHPDVEMQRGVWDRIVFPDGAPVMQTLNTAWAVVSTIVAMLSSAARGRIVLPDWTLSPEVVNYIVAAWFKRFRSANYGEPIP